MNSGSLPGWTEQVRTSTNTGSLTGYGRAKNLGPKIHALIVVSMHTFAHFDELWGSSDCEPHRLLA
jgi:hypothetical protein